VSDKLLRKMLSVKDPEKELWSGFEVTKDIFTGGFKYAVWVGDKDAVWVGSKNANDDDVVLSPEHEQE
jgi:hypothetical protein